LYADLGIGGDVEVVLECSAVEFWVYPGDSVEGGE
jgi:hypothetical protein